MSQCLGRDGQNADKSIGMPQRKPCVLWLCPQVAEAVGFLHEAAVSDVEPGSILHLWPFGQNLHSDLLTQW